MSIDYLWFGYKIDNSHKRHLCGCFSNEYSLYIFHAAGKNGKANLRRTDNIQEFYRRKVNAGYKEITRERVMGHWENVIADIEMQFLLGKLSGQSV